MNANGSRPLGPLPLLVFFAAACGAAPTPRPQLVAAYPRTSPAGQPADGPVVTEKITLILDVTDPSAAAERAAAGAAGCGGYEAGRSGWETAGRRAVSQTLFVPQFRAEDFRSLLLSLGAGADETRSGFGRSFPGEWTEFAVTYYPIRSGYSGDGAGPGLFLCDLWRKAFLLLSQASAAVLLAVCIVLPIGWMIVGAAATVRWVLGNRGD